MGQHPRGWGLLIGGEDSTLVTFFPGSLRLDIYSLHVLDGQYLSSTV